MKIPKIINLKKEGQYCISCFAPTVKRIFKAGKTFYACSTCRKVNSRSLVIDNKIVWWVDEKNNYWHESVGAVVFNNESKILCLMRKIYPFAYTLPAGHLDAGENSISAVKRELLEETGLKIPSKKFELIAEFDLARESCRRGSDHHRWHLFKTALPSNISIDKVNDEANSYSWLSVGQLLKKRNVVFPLRYILKTYGKGLTK